MFKKIFGVFAGVVGVFEKFFGVFAGFLDCPE
jgi:hypothetical protein